MTRQGAIARTRRLGSSAVLLHEYDDIVTALGRPINTDLPRVRGTAPKWTPEPQERDRLPRPIEVIR